MPATTPIIERSTPHQIMAITGHKALAEVETYTRAVRQQILAEQAMEQVVVAFPDQEPS